MSAAGALQGVVDAMRPNWYRWKLESTAVPEIEGRVEPYRYEGYDAQPLMKAMLIAVRSVENAIKNQSGESSRRHIPLWFKPVMAATLRPNTHSSRS